jgi:hypothetical protein
MDVQELLTRSEEEADELSNEEVRDEGAAGGDETEDGELTSAAVGAASAPPQAEAAACVAYGRSASLGPPYSAKVRAAGKQIAAALYEKKARDTAWLPRVLPSPCPQVHVLLELCARFGVSLARRVLAQSLQVELAGGMATTDGSRRRERGGAYLALFKTSVPAEAWRTHLRAVKSIEKSRRAKQEAKNTVTTGTPGCHAAV